MEKTFMRNSAFECYETICHNLYKTLSKNKKTVIQYLIEYETLKMAEDEFSRSINLLLNINSQKKYLYKRFSGKLSAFLPLNQPLYSLLLQVVIPSLVLEKVYYRPPAAQSNLHSLLYNVISPTCDNIYICNVSRNKFLCDYVRQSNIINFTGKYENAIELTKVIPNNIAIIYNGSAINPIVVSTNTSTKLNKIVDDVVLTRMYNSGQDCMAPACVFVEKNIVPDFIEILKKKITNLPVGENAKKETVVGPMIEKSSLIEYKSFREKCFDHILIDGHIDEKKQLIHPAVFYFDKVNLEIQNIYYAPYLILMAFDTLKDIQSYLHTPYCEKHAGYISIYGKDIYHENWCSGKNKLIPLYEKTLLHTEDGNNEFGGYGLGCSFVSNQGEIKSHPILLSREIHNIMSKKEK